MRSLVLLLAAAACAAPTTPNARYIGAATPATPSDLCKPSHASIRLHDGQALFVPDETTWTLTGTADPNGAVQAERDGRGANKQPYPTRFAGTWTTHAVTGTYTTPRCTYAVQLARD